MHYFLDNLYRYWYYVGMEDVMVSIQEAKDRMNQATFHRYENAELNHQNIVVLDCQFAACDDGQHEKCPNVAAISRKNFTVSVCRCKCHKQGDVTFNAKCQKCGAGYADKWIGHSCLKCNGDIL